MPKPTGARGAIAALLAWIERRLRLARRAVEGTAEQGAFIAGAREEWADFARRNRQFLERMPSLKAAMNAAFVDPGSVHATPADMMVFFLGRLCAEDFSEIILLSANGYGVGATKLLRGFYERVVTARYLRKHPDEAEAFMAWGVVSEGKRAREVLDVFGANLAPEKAAKLKEVIETARAERPRFVVDDCKTCKTTKLNHTWSKLDFVSMAKSVDGLTGDYIFPCYLEPLRHAHATVGALEARVKEADNVFTFHPGPTRAEADNALMLAHMLMLNICDLFFEHFAPDGLEEPLKNAVIDYGIVWELPEVASSGA